MFSDKLENYEYIVNIGRAPEPEIIKFRYAREAINIIKKHVNMRSLVSIHGDVDMDGIGATYIAKVFLSQFGMKNRIRICINSEKEHGVDNRHVEYFKRLGANLVVILDSGTNDIDAIKSMQCDVIVVDHHDILHNELIGDTAGGKYVIINNNIENEDGTYKADSKMSGAMVLYELLRYLQMEFSTPDVLKNLLLYQWVGITLITDAIPLDSKRNQWYMDNTVHSSVCEAGISTLIKGLDRRRFGLDKSFIQYKLAPTFNRAIRAGYSTLALDIAINNQSNIKELEVFRKIQDDIVKDYMKNTCQYDNYCIRDNTSLGINKNYNGVLGAKILDHTNKNTAVFLTQDDMAIGSFRGKYTKVDYRKYFGEYAKYVFAQGHSNAFGFKIKLDDLHKVMNNLEIIERDVDNKEYLTAGNMAENCKGKYHIEDILEFKRQGLFINLAVINSKLSNEEQINIIVSGGDIECREIRQNSRVYEVLGIKCIAFEEIVTPLAKLYVEFDKEVKCYIRNKWR